MEVIKRSFTLGGIPFVEIVDEARAQSSQGIFLIEALHRIGRVGKKREMEVRVAVSQVPDFKIPHRLPDLILAPQKHGNDDHRCVFFGYAFRKIEFRELPGRHQHGCKQIHQGHGTLRGGQEKERQFIPSESSHARNRLEQNHDGNSEKRNS